MGDEVIICGKLMNYKGNTPETVSGEAYLYSLNGQTDGGGSGSGQASGDGTLTNPYNPLGAINAVSGLTWTSNTDYQKTGEVYVKGKISRIATKGTFAESGDFGNASFWISEDGKTSNEFQCYRILYLGNQKYTSGTDIKVGDEVIICGKLMNYKGNTPETVAGEAYLYSLKSQSGGGSSSGGDTSGEVLTALVNGNFETWSGGLPTGWKSASTASSATLSQSTDAHGGSYSVNVNGKESGNVRLASQEIKLAAGTYVFSFWAKATTADAVQARPGYVAVVDGAVSGSYNYTDYVDLSTSWKQFSYEFTLSAETTLCLVVMNPKKSDYSSGKDILIDDAALTKK